jgi:diphthamide synthase (EF-2-diphthine--ammonia ligase)
VGNAFYKTLLKERENERKDEEEEDVSSFLMTLRKQTDAGIVLFGEVASEEATDLAVRQNTQ